MQKLVAVLLVATGTVAIISTPSGLAAPGPAVPLPGELIISEYRARGPAGAADEFIEIHNTRGEAFIVQASDASSGLGIVASDGVVRCVIPNGTSIPPHGHFLCANNTPTIGYSLGGQPDSVPNATYTTDISVNMGVGLFTSTTNFSQATRVDAVGPTTVTNALFREGAGHTPGANSNLQHSWLRKTHSASGAPIDTGDNAADFIYIETSGTLISATDQRLGAPGPQNLSAPTNQNASLPVERFDPNRGANTNPHREWDGTPVANGALGTLTFRGKITNLTDGNITRLRFRVSALTTFPEPQANTRADLRAISSSDRFLTLTTGETVLVRGTTHEEPPSQPFGGGINATFAVSHITPANPLPPRGVTYVQFRFGVEKLGNFHVLLNAEALPANPTGPLRINSITRLSNGNVRLTGNGQPGRRHTIQSTFSFFGDDLIPVYPDGYVFFPDLNNFVTTNAFGDWQYEAPVTADDSARFFRVGLPYLHSGGLP
jgi:hypothetical protein